MSRKASARTSGLHAHDRVDSRAPEQAWESLQIIECPQGLWGVLRVFTCTVGPSWGCCACVPAGLCCCWHRAPAIDRPAGAIEHPAEHIPGDWCLEHLCNTSVIVWHQSCLLQQLEPMLVAGAPLQ